jgi:hypothetical protein
MKCQKVIFSAVTACLMVLGSNTAMAVDCADGSIVGSTVEEIVIDDFVDCFIANVTVEGMIRIRGANQIIIVGSVVTGKLLVANTVSAALIQNHVFGGSLIARGNTYSSVARNTVISGNLLVDETFKQAAVVENDVGGDMRVNRNEKVDVKNNTVGGNLSCQLNDRLDSFGNKVSGTKNCKSVKQD